MKYRNAAEQLTKGKHRIMYKLHKAAATLPMNVLHEGWVSGKECSHMERVFWGFAPPPLPPHPKQKDRHMYHC